MGEEDNLFILLDLDPKCRDPSVVQDTIRSKRMAWKREESQGANSAAASVRLEKLRLLEGKAVSAEALTTEAKAASRILRKRRNAALKKLDPHIALLKVHGFFSPQQIANIERDLDGVLSRETIEKQLKSAGLHEKKERTEPEEDPWADRPRLDRAYADRIRQQLDAIDKATLYEALDLPASTSSGELLKRASELYREIQDRGDTGNRIQASLKVLAGQAVDIFADDDKRRRYDHSIAFEIFEAFRPLIETAGAKGYLTRADHDALLRQMTVAGCDAGDAEAFVRHRAVKRGWHIEDAQQRDARQIDIWRCPCGELQVGDERMQCRSCDRDLHVSCPSCGHSCRIDLHQCPRCGFETGNQVRLERLVDRARSLEQSDDLSGAAASFREALSLWPNWPPAAQGLSRVEALAQRRSEFLAKVRALRNDNKLFAVETLLATESRDGGGEALEKLANQNRKDLERARQLLIEARQTANSGRQAKAIALCRDALSIAGDYGEAAALIQRLPPPAPSRVVVERNGHGFRLHWDPVRSHERHTYRIMRKIGSAIHSGQDGQEIGTTAMARFDDGNAPVGVPVYYGVFSVRDGVISGQAALVGPVLRTESVSNLVSDADATSIALRWKKPAGTVQIKVWRRLNTEPEAAGDGKQVRAGLEGAVDQPLRTGNVYGYRVVPYFRDPEDAEGVIAGPGATILTRTQQRPEPVMDLTLQGKTAHVLDIAFTEPERGNLHLYMCGRGQDPVVGRRMPAVDVGTIGTRIADRELRARKVSLTQSGSQLLVPVTILEDQAVIGQGLLVQHFEAAANFDCDPTAGGFVFYWRWPDGAHAARLSLSSDRIPKSPNDPAAEQHTMLRKGDRARMEIVRSEPGEFFILLSFAASLSGPFLPNLGRQIRNSLPIRITYELVLHTRRFPRALLRAALRVTAENDVVVRGLVVVASADRIPLRIEDGDRLLRVDALELKRNRPCDLDLDVSRLSRGQTIRLFLHHAFEHDPVRLQQLGSTRVS